MPDLSAAAARRLINPPLGIKRAGIRIFADPIQAIESDLTVTALVLSDGHHRLAILALDLGLMSMREMNGLRQRVAAALDSPASSVLVNLSHTHSSPAMPDFIPDTEEQMALKEQYLQHVIQEAVEAAADAADRLQPARIGADCGSSHIGVYRRATGPDGKGVLGEVLDAPIDPAVGVIRVDDLQGRTLATLFSYGCHPVVMGPRAHVASADFPGTARDVVERCQGGLSLFLQACGGNINPLGGIGYEVDGRDTRQRVGTMLGAEVLKVAAGIRTHVVRGEPTPIGPLANILLWPWQAVRGETCTFLDATERTVSLDYGPLPPLAEATAIHDKWKQKLADDRARGAHEWEVNFSEHFAHWSSRLLAAVEQGRPTLDVVIQALRVNDVVLLGISIESFFETGLAIKARSPFPHTQVLGYTNGCVGYLPRAEDYPPGGWSVHELYALPDMFFQSYSLPVALHEGSEKRVVEAALEVLKSLSA